MTKEIRARLKITIFTPYSNKKKLQNTVNKYLTIDKIKKIPKNWQTPKNKY